MDDLPHGIFRVGSKYRLRVKIGSGSFGDVYRADNVITKQGVAVKLEAIDNSRSRLQHEWTVYKELGHAPGIPRPMWFGTESGYRALVMELLGPSLEELFNLCHRKFSLKTVLMVGDQMISRIKYVHHQGYIHCDIKPDNFVLGTPQNPHIHLIDFGLATKYQHGPAQNHIALSTGNGVLGTARYFSINTHAGLTQSRRDDLESLAYVLIYFLRGSLPWQHLEGRTRKQRFLRIQQMKINSSIIELCSGLPEEFCAFLSYVRNLPFSCAPDYEHLQNLLHNAFDRAGYVNDSNFDWTSKIPRVNSLSHTSHSIRPALPSTSITGHNDW
ncbi:kinase-like domain-containing protein [Lyophyllum atratum]|nr:kinase-like domain-containing protein [Lyophyllum atratum]KAF8056994.1 kinase-like domain-containing protein [Lyophyllum atratum]